MYPEWAVSEATAEPRIGAALRQKETPRRDRACVRHSVRYEVFDNSHGHGILRESDLFLVVMPPAILSLL